MVKSNGVNSQIFIWTASLSNQCNDAVLQIQYSTAICFCSFWENYNWATTSVVEEAVVVTELFDAKINSTLLSFYYFREGQANCTLYCFIGAHCSQTNFAVDNYHFCKTWTILLEKPDIIDEAGLITHINLSFRFLYNKLIFLCFNKIIVFVFFIELNFNVVKAKDAKEELAN